MRQPEALRDGYEALEGRIREVPGVESASIVGGSVPMTGDSELPFWVVGRPHATEQTQAAVVALLHGVGWTTGRRFEAP